jgi:hypothetical protein
MEPKRVRGWGGWLALAGLTVLPLVLYVGAYYATVQRSRPFVYLTGGPPRVAVSPEYSHVPRSLWTAFGPMHAVDRLIRPNAWEKKLPPTWKP